MEQPFKKQKIKLSVIHENDRISRLPDPILHLILSHLESRNAVQTTLLSRRWNNLWASMPYINIYSTEGSVFQFERFVNFLLLRREPSSNIHTFSLDFTYVARTGRALDPQHLNTWIEHVVKRDVKILHIHVLVEGVADLRSCLFTCHSLEELTLVFDSDPWNLATTEFSELGRLRKLHMRRVTTDCETFKKLISGCPALEELKMTQCDLYGHELDISLNSLKRLSIGECSIIGTAVQISSPNLQYMYFMRNDINCPEVSLEKLSSLTDAFVQVDNYSVDDPSVELEPVKFATSSTKEKLPGLALETFCNLKELTLEGMDMKKNVDAVAYFLERSPNLKMLTLQGVYDQKERCKHLYSCPHLKIKIQFICGGENDGVIEMVEQFLLSKCNCH